MVALLNKVFGKKIKFTAIVVALSVTSCSVSTTNQGDSLSESIEIESQWTYLLDDKLTQWEIWSGVPHHTVKDLPDGTYTADNLNIHGDPKLAMGLNNDVKDVFSVIEGDGGPILYITGEIYGGLTTLKSFKNYHLSLKVKWGEKKWAPRLNAKRDSGLLFHCKGEHGAFWRVWKACQELQIQESDFGDYIPLAGPSGVVKTIYKDGKPTYSPTGKPLFTKDYTDAYIEPDYPNGQWNTVDLYAYNDKAYFSVNGKVVMVVEQSKDIDGNILDEGQIQLQSEGAEVYYKDIKIRNISTLPKHVL